jgi:hypothetical protein
VHYFFDSNLRFYTMTSLHACTQFCVINSCPPQSLVSVKMIYSEIGECNFQKTSVSNILPLLAELTIDTIFRNIITVYSHKNKFEGTAKFISICWPHRDSKIQLEIAHLDVNFFHIGSAFSFLDNFFRQCHQMGLIVTGFAILFVY